MSFAEMLRSEFRDLQIEISLPVIQRLALYASEVEHWNRSINLTSLRGQSLVRRLIVDPVWVGAKLEMNGCLSDVGSGNGSPGIPLSITRPFTAAHLIEPRTKRAVFLRHVAAKLGLRNVTVNHCRVESMPANTVTSDWIALQAIDPSPALLQALTGIANRTTRVVWITSIFTPPVAAAEGLEIPGSNTRFWIFRLDQI